MASGVVSPVLKKIGWFSRVVRTLTNESVGWTMKWKIHVILFQFVLMLSLETSCTTILDANRSWVSISRAIVCLKTHLKIMQGIFIEESKAVCITYWSYSCKQFVSSESRDALFVQYHRVLSHNVRVVLFSATIYTKNDRSAAFFDTNRQLNPATFQFPWEIGSTGLATDQWLKLDDLRIILPSVALHRHCTRELYTAPVDCNSYCSSQFMNWDVTH